MQKTVIFICIYLKEWNWNKYENERKKVSEYKSDYFINKNIIISSTNQRISPIIEHLIRLRNRGLCFGSAELKIFFKVNKIIICSLKKAQLHLFQAKTWSTHSGSLAFPPYHTHTHLWICLIVSNSIKTYNHMISHWMFFLEMFQASRIEGEGEGWGSSLYSHPHP